MQNQPVTEELLQEMTEKIVREVNPRKVVLFGSHARGTARPDSDLDFLVYSSEEVAKWQCSKNHVIHHAMNDGRILYEC